MSHYSIAELEERKNEGIKMHRLDCGWNLPPLLTAEIIRKLYDWAPNVQSKVEKRDIKICIYAFVENMNAQQIERLGDPELVSYSHNGRGKPLSSRSIYRIAVARFPEVAAYQREKRQLRSEARRKNSLSKERLAFSNSKLAGEIERPKLCAVCGSKKHLELHHIIPLSMRGTNEYFNIINLCHSCHMKLHKAMKAWWREAMSGSGQSA